MRHWLLTLEIVASPLTEIFLGIAAVGLVIAIVVPPRHPWRVLIAAGVGAVFGVGAYLLLNGLNVFGIQLPFLAEVYAVAGLAGCGAAIAAAWDPPWWRRTIAIIAAVAALLGGGLGVNKTFAVNHNLASLFGIQAADPIVLPPVTSTAVPTAPLYQTWTPPAGMPAKGQVGALVGDALIPSPGFTPREGAIYLPPAALVPNPPALPLIVFMMGQPGSPDPTSLQRTLDAYAAKHQGLAPIAIIADQLGATTVDPACADSQRYGAVSSYFNVSIPQWARTHLNVIDDPRYWTIGGYSNGGACAWAWAAQFPGIWGNVFAVSGNEFPGSETIKKTVAEVFGGNQDAFTAASPLAQLARHPGAYAGHVAIFTMGAEDDTFGPGIQRNAKAAADAGFTVHLEQIPGAGHVGNALDGGLTAGVADLGSALGLAPPG
ncbi:alpha/beta hydrolase-fold protein [Microbacterium sp. X-17]|uniref:alpha/beta hydrolase-fold protein n=1 Tax=Microbacterium sp. X-17 TaxID=3144404 RepID=UPI0031F4B0AD